jgi:hypothetical protein
MANLHPLLPKISIARISSKRLSLRNCCAMARFARIPGNRTRLPRVGRAKTFVIIYPDRFGGPPATASRRAIHMVTFGGPVLKKKCGFLGENVLIVSYSLIVPLWTLPSGVDMWVQQWNILFHYPSVYDLLCTFFNTFIVTFPHLLVTFAGTYFCCEWLDHRPRS